MEPYKIIWTLNDLGMSDGSIAAMIGRSRVCISMISNHRSRGSNTTIERLKLLLYSQNYISSYKINHKRKLDYM